MRKITFIGAGSAVFTRNIVIDLLSFPKLEESIISLMDIDEKRLELIGALAEKMVKERRLKTRIEITLNRRKALKEADYVIATFRVGGIKPCEMDVDIPTKYGVEQCMGDIIGPGGVFRGLRTVPVLLDICKDMEELCPDAYLLNYVNPMAINTWAISEVSNIKVVGLCHSVPNTAKELASYLGMPVEEISYWVAGINHMSWFLKLERNGKNLYPLLYKKMKDKKIYNKDKIRFEIMKYFGYFVTESSCHMSEYVPYFRKRKDLISQFNCPTKLGIQWVKSHWSSQSDEIKRQLKKKKEIKYIHSGEYASYIIHSLETGKPRRVNLNVKNQGLITNLPKDCIVEIPCLVDKMGIHPLFVGELPPQLAALNRTNINTQELATKAALIGDKDLVLQAIMLDPLTGAVLSLSEIEKMVGEMFKVEAEYLPQFK